MQGYIKKGYEVKKVFTIEYLDNKKDLEYVNSGSMMHGDPMDRYKKLEYDDMEKAINVFSRMNTNCNLYDVKMFTQTIVNGELIEEDFIQLENVTYTQIATNINEDLRKSYIDATNKVNMLELENEKLKNYLKQFNIDIKKIVA